MRELPTSVPASVTDLRRRRRERVEQPPWRAFDVDAEARAVHELADLEAVMDAHGVGVVRREDFDDTHSYEQALAESVGESLADRMRRHFTDTTTRETTTR